MDDVISSIAAQLGLEESVTRRAVGQMLAFLQKEGPAEPVQKLIKALPGSQGLIADNSGGGMFGMGGLMGLGTALMSAGLSMTQVSELSRALFAKGRALVGEDTMGEIVAGIPGLSQFV